MIAYSRYHIAAIRRLLGVAGFSLLFPLLITAQTDDPNPDRVADILHNLRVQFNRVQDYQVDLRVSLDMPVLRMPRKKMTFSFKQPDKIRLEAVGFAMVPRRGLALSPDSLLQNLRNLELVGDTLLDGHNCLILQGVEEGPDGMRFRADVFVDQDLWLVRAVTTYLENHEVLHLATSSAFSSGRTFCPGAIPESRSIRS
ncbi:hypothetical protein ACFL4K_03315 [Candidatus Neomarinimicrobiota bacterium]